MLLWRILVSRVRIIILGSLIAASVSVVGVLAYRPGPATTAAVAGAGASGHASPATGKVLAGSSHPEPNGPVAAGAPTGTVKPATSDQAAGTSTVRSTAAPAGRSGGESSSGAASPKLIIEPNVTTLNAYGNANDSPHVSLSDGREIGELTQVLPDTLRIEWRDDGKGHYNSGPYYPGWIGWVMRGFNPRGGGDSTVTVIAKDRAGNSFSGKLRIIWPLERYIVETPGAVTKTVEGDMNVYTARVNLEPGPTFGTPTMRIFVSAGGGSNCPGGQTDQTFQYDGRRYYDVVCKIPTGVMQNAPYGADFQANISADGVNNRYIVNYATFKVY